MRLAPNRPLCHSFLVPMAENEVKQLFEDPLSAWGQHGNLHFLGDTWIHLQLLKTGRHGSCHPSLPWQRLVDASIPQPRQKLSRNGFGAYTMVT